MSTRLDQLTEEAMALTPRERMQLAARMWESVDAVEFEASVLDEVVRRDGELTSGAVHGLPREEVMERLRKRAACE